MPSNSFSPKAYFERLVHLWWVLFIAIAIGGALGAGISALRPPRYEVAAMISTSVDYTILPELEDYEEDRIINEAGWVMLSDDILEQVRDAAQEASFDISIEELRDIFSADRIDDLWSLRVIGTDPRAAAELANIWVDISYQTLSSAHEAALEASAIRSEIAALSSCMPETEGSGLELALCESEDLNSLQSSLDNLTEELDQQLGLSRGLNPASNYSVVRYADVPGEPVYRARGIMALLGMVLGLTGGMIALWLSGKKE